MHLFEINFLKLYKTESALIFDFKTYLEKIKSYKLFVKLFKYYQE